MVTWRWPRSIVQFSWYRAEVTHRPKRASEVPPLVYKEVILGASPTPVPLHGSGRERGAHLRPAATERLFRESYKQACNI